MGQANPHYEENLEVAKQIHNAIQEKYPCLSRGVFSKGKSEGNGIYNQDLTKRALLLEVGGVDNYMFELNNTVHAFAEIFSNYYWKSKDVGEF